MRTIRTYVSKISVSVLLIVGPKCTLAASNAAAGESRSVYLRGRQTDGRTDGRTQHRYITLSAVDGCNHRNNVHRVHFRHETVDVVTLLSIKPR